MSVSDLVQAAAARGVELWFEGDRLRFRAPKGALTPEQRNDLVARRADVLTYLREQAARATTTCPLSFSQRSLWFVNQETPDSAAYNVGFAARIVSEIDVNALRQAMQALSDRHPALRTSFPIVDGIPVQSIAGTSTAVLTVHDVAGEDEPRVRARVVADYRAPFDLEHGPVFRSHLYSAGPQNHVLLLTVHHIAVDGWSLMQLSRSCGPSMPKRRAARPCPRRGPQRTMRSSRGGRPRCWTATRVSASRSTGARRWPSRAPR